MYIQTASHTYDHSDTPVDLTALLPAAEGSGNRGEFFVVAVNDGSADARLVQSATDDADCPEVVEPGVGPVESPRFTWVAGGPGLWLHLDDGASVRICLYRSVVRP